MKTLYEVLVKQNIKNNDNYIEIINKLYNANIIHKYDDPHAKYPSPVFWIVDAEHGKNSIYFYENYVKLTNAQSGKLDEAPKSNKYEDAFNKMREDNLAIGGFIYHTKIDEMLDILNELNIEFAKVLKDDVYLFIANNISKSNVVKLFKKMSQLI